MTSFESQLSFWDKLELWTGWSDLYEHRTKIIISVVSVIVGMFAIGYVLCHYLSSSASATIQGEAIFQQWTEGSESAEDNKLSFAKIQAMLPRAQKSSMQFRGALAQESLLHHLPVTSWKNIRSPFISPALNIYDEIILITELIERQHIDLAMQHIDQALSQPLSPMIEAYLLLQKVALCKEQGAPQADSVLRLERLITQHEQLHGLFDTIDAIGASSIVEFFRPDPIH